MGQQNYQRNCKAVKEKQPPERKPQTGEYLSIHLPPRFLLTFLSIYFSASSFNFFPFFFLYRKVSYLQKSTKYILKVKFGSLPLSLFSQMSENPCLKLSSVLTKFMPFGYTDYRFSRDYSVLYAGANIVSLHSCELSLIVSCVPHKIELTHIEQQPKKIQAEEQLLWNTFIKNMKTKSQINSNKKTSFPSWIHLQLLTVVVPQESKEKEMWPIQALLWVIT